MAKNSRLTPVEYLDRFFDTLREEVRSNPKLAAQLVSALGGEVSFSPETRAEVANPYAMAASGSKAAFLSTFSTMKAADIRRILRENNLATRVDMSGKSADQLVDMMYERAAGKISERTSSIY